MYDAENASQAVSSRLVIRTTQGVKNLFEACCEVRQMDRDDAFHQLARKFCLETVGIAETEVDEDELKAGVDREFRFGRETGQLLNVANYSGK